jgi:hypothetical protein
MPKIKLDLDALDVQSFETVAGAPGAPGTVHGHMPRTIEPDASQESCDGLCGGGTGYNTCGATCEACSGDTCDAWSCDFSGAGDCTAYVGC